MRICKNKLTDIVREHFDASPIKNPQSRIRPLTVFEVKDQQPIYLGSFKHLIQGGLPITPELKKSKVAKVSGVKTRKVKLKLGFNVLENFLKAFGIDPIVVSVALKDAKKLSFSFDNVVQHYFDPLELGAILSAHQIIGNPDNIFVKKIINRPELKLALTTDVFTSNNFKLSAYTENEVATALEIPILQKYISEVEAKVDIASTAKNEIQFKGQEALSFAFSCVEIRMDSNTGQFSVGDWLNNLKTARGESNESGTPGTKRVPRMIFDDSVANPLMLEL